MTSLFVFASMAILGATTVLGIFTNCVIVSVNLTEKARGKASLGSSDLILVTLGLSNIIFQLVMTANDFLSLLWSQLYYSDEVYNTLNTLLFLPAYASFWFTVCLCVYYCLQIVIFTNPFLLRVKGEIPKLVPWFLVIAVLTAIAIGVPAFWSTYKDTPSGDLPNNQSLDTEVPKLNLTYLLASNIIGCSLPLVLVGISNGLILKSLVTRSKLMEKNTSSPRTEAKERAARTVSLLLALYLVFYMSEIMMFVDLFPPSSPGFCICLMVIYIYSPAQSVILILGSPKLKKALQSLFQLLVCWKKKQMAKPNILFITLPGSEGSRLPK
ncbi:taste receptor type 2 member 40-like [Rana temporaria]|uniref:taste receptor type 2 member 40-like n=1 Tax=Rana temporaria TaxID=8407 RepID=UPI001AACB03A|nr:taste receptor type 2 member 40-like [Rana temporaria]